MSGFWWRPASYPQAPDAKLYGFYRCRHRNAINMDEPWTIGRLLTWTTDYLKKHGAESPRLDAEVLLAHARGCPRIDLYTCFTEIASLELRDAFRELVKRRASGTPVAYLVGHREFYSRDFRVTPDVLIPRPETEFVLVAALDLMHAREQQSQLADQPDHPPDTASAPEGDVPRKRQVSQVKWSLADVGTGSGVLAVCLALHLPKAQVTAIDISAAALRVAEANARAHDVQDRIEFVESNLFANIPSGRQFDLIVSNPPYVADAERSTLPRDVLNFEPHAALFAGGDGLDVLRALIPAAAERLHPGGFFVTEFSPPQHASLLQIAAAAGLTMVRTVEDLSKRPRVVVWQRPVAS